MTKGTISKISLATAILFIALAVIVFIFAEGLRRWYSGIFFLLIGIAVFVTDFVRQR